MLILYLSFIENDNNFFYFILLARDCFMNMKIGKQAMDYSFDFYNNKTKTLLDFIKKDKIKEVTTIKNYLKQNLNQFFEKFQQIKINKQNIQKHVQTKNVKNFIFKMILLKFTKIVFLKN